MTFVLLMSSVIIPISTSAEEIPETRNPPIIKIGFLNDETGPISIYAAAFEAAAEIAEDHINAMQSQYTFEIVMADSGCADSIAQTAAQSLVNSGVVAVAGAACSGASMGANSLLSSYGIPQVSYASTSPALSDDSVYPGFMRIVPSDGQSGQANNYVLNQTGDSNPALVYADSLSWLADSFIQSYGQSNLCGEWSYYSWEIDSDDDFGDEVYSIVGEGCDSVVMFTHSVDGAYLVEELRDWNFAGSIIGGGDTESNQGIIGPNWPDEFYNPSEANGVRAVKSVYPGPQTNIKTIFEYECSQDSDCSTGIYTNEAYDSIRIIADAYINRTSYSSLEDSIMGTGTNWEGASGYVTFLPNGDVVGNGFDICEWVSQNLSCTEVWLPLPVTEVEIIFVDSDWAPIIPNLNGGGMCDAILSAMTKTDDREDVVDFTRSYYTHSQGIIGASGSASITDVSDLNTAGTIIGVQSGTTSELYAYDQLSAATLYAYDAFPDLITALNNGDIDYALGDTPVLSLEGTIMAIFEEENFGIAVREDSGELLDALNVAITRIVDSGEYDLIFGDWFNGTLFLIDDRDANTATSYPIPSVGSTLSSVLSSGQLRVCAEMYYPPFTSYDDDGNPVGFDVDFGEAIANELTEHYVSPDTDGDGWSDAEEVDCSTDPNDGNSIPLDSDSDDVCDVVDLDDDNDGFSDIDEITNCGENNDPLNPVNTPTDTDGDQICNGLDEDDDNDGYDDGYDAFPLDSNEWDDSDGDGIGSNTDTDDDGDGWLDVDEVDCLTAPDSAFSIPDDSDGDWICDIVDTDDDNDGYLDTEDWAPFNPSEWIDTDDDGTGDNADHDDDNDGMLDEFDWAPLDFNEWLDTDGDEIGDNADDDDDGDLWSDSDEQSCETDSLDSESIPVDTDGDLICDLVDIDDDDDGITDTSDAFPLDPNENLDTDKDGIGNNADFDDDDDGYSDIDEASNCGSESDPLDDSSTPLDFDLDLICDMLDEDVDNDGYLDTVDLFPYDSNEWYDNDMDGIGDNADLDDDDDGILDDSDSFPLDPNEWQDRNNDGLGDNAYPLSIIEEISLHPIMLIGSLSIFFAVIGVTIFRYSKKKEKILLYQEDDVSEQKIETAISEKVPLPPGIISPSGSHKVSSWERLPPGGNYTETEPMGYVDEEGSIWIRQQDESWEMQ